MVADIHIRRNIMNGNVKSADGVSITYRVEGSGNPPAVAPVASNV